MLKTLVGCAAAAACVIGSAPPAQAAPSSCWWFTPDTYGEADEENCDVTLITVPSDRTTSGYLKQWVIDDYVSKTRVRLTLWDDDSAEIEFIDRRGRVTRTVYGDTWIDADGDTRVSFGDSGYSLAIHTAAWRITHWCTTHIPQPKPIASGWLRHQ